jgi:uncharacterized protein (DUF169 family)
MIWKEYSGRLKELLDLKENPIAITYSMTPASGGSTRLYWVCQALLDTATKGRIINLSEQNSVCLGGTLHLGLASPPPKLSEKDLAHKQYLIEGEKMYRTLAAHNRMRSLRPAPPPTGLAKYIVFSPLEKAELEPDLVVFLCNAMQCCRLLTLAVYPDGIPPKTCLAGSACYMTISYPLATGEINANFMDYTVRSRIKPYKDDQVFVTIPYSKMAGLMESIPLCCAGTAPHQLKPPKIMLKTK